MGDRNSKLKGTKETLLLVGPQYPGWIRDTQESPIVTTRARGLSSQAAAMRKVQPEAQLGTPGLDPQAAPPDAVLGFSPRFPYVHLLHLLPTLLCPAEMPPTLQDLSTPQCPPLPNPSHSTILHRLVHHLAGPEPHTPSPPEAQG